MTGPEEDFDPAWSQDGTRILFQRRITAARTISLPRPNGDRGPPGLNETTGLWTGPTSPGVGLTGLYLSVRRPTAGASRSLPDVGQVRVFLGPQRGRTLRFLAALQVPDPRPRRRTLPVGRPRPRHPGLRAGERAVHGLVRRPRLRGRGRRHPADRGRRVPADRRRAEPRLLRGPHRSPRPGRDRGRQRRLRDPRAPGPALTRPAGCPRSGCCEPPVLRPDDRRRSRARR